MSRRGVLVALLIAASLWTWRSQLFVVQRPGAGPEPLRALPEAGRPLADLDVVLPAVPVGMAHLRHGERALLVHYWAPWERHGARQAALLDSLSRLPELHGLRVAIVCFDPFPSVARYVARQRLRVAVLLDPERRMRAALPCPSVPYTYVVDARGRVLVAQAGEVDWLAPGSRSLLKDAIDAVVPDSRPVPPS